MARKGPVENNKKRLAMINSYKAKRSEIKEQLKNKELDFMTRMNLVFKLDKMPKNSSQVRYRNRCSLTGRPRAYYRDFGVCRIALRDLASYGQLPGVRKSSW